VTPTTRYLCPLLDCDWHYDDTDLTPDDTRGVQPNRGATDLQGALASIVEQVMFRKASRINSLVEAHVSTHSVLEWMTEVARLQGALVRLGYDPLTLQPRTPQEPAC